MRVLTERQLADFAVVGEAGSGRQAIELAEQLRPDIILMDIQMPGLTGLDAMREIRTRFPDIRCVILTAHDQFHFAQQALRLGAADYLLKPVKRDKLLESLRRVADEIHIERQRRVDELAGKERWHQIQPVLEAELCRMLQRPDADPYRRAALQQSVGLRFEAGLAVVAAVHDWSTADRPRDPERLLEQCHERLSQVAHGLCSCAVGSPLNEQVSIFVELDDPDDDYATRLWSMELARRLRDRVKEQTGVRFRMGVGNAYRGAAALHRSYREALRAAADVAVSEKVNHYADLFPEEPPPAGGGRSTARDAVEQARRYIDTHFAADLTLERVAREVGLSPYYFSKAFKQMVGETFVEYLARVRVQEAKKMLAAPNASIKEVGYGVGYNDPNYFSRVFRKLTGRAPSEWREGQTK